MSDTQPPRGGLSGLMIFLLTIAWIGGTIAFLAAAFAESFCSLGHCEIEVSEHHRLLADRLFLCSLACACLFPALAALICAFTERRVGTVLFLILGGSAALGYGMTVGAGAVRDIHSIERPASNPVPSTNCPCYSGGSCDCPGG